MPPSGAAGDAPIEPSHNVRHALVGLAFALSLVAPLQGQVRDSLPPTIILPPDLARVLTDYEVAYPRGGVAIAEPIVENGFVL